MVFIAIDFLNVGINAISREGDGESESESAPRGWLTVFKIGFWGRRFCTSSRKREDNGEPHINGAVIERRDRMGVNGLGIYV